MFLLSQGQELSPIEYLKDANVIVLKLGSVPQTSEASNLSPSC